MAKLKPTQFSKDSLILGNKLHNKVHELLTVKDVMEYFRSKFLKSCENNSDPQVQEFVNFIEDEGSNPEGLLGYLQDYMPNG